MKARLFVGNLNPRTTEQELRAFFSSAGSLVELTIPIDRKTRRPRGFAFVELSSADEAERALSTLSGKLLGGNPLRLSWAREREPAKIQRWQRPTSETIWRRVPIAELEELESWDAVPRSPDDYARKRRSKPLRHGKHGSDRIRGRGTRRSIR